MSGADRPATLSRRIVNGMLREELGYQGVIVSDDLEMKAIANTWTVPDAAVQAVAAGCDALLVCSGDVDLQAEALEALVHAAEDGRIATKALEETHRRLRKTKERFLAAPVGAPRRSSDLRQVLGCDAHRRVADEMARFL